MSTGLNAAETLAKSAGHLYLAPIGTGAPDAGDITDRAALELDGWIHVGWIDEDGPNPQGFEGVNTKHFGWNATTAIRSTTRITEPMIEVGLLQWNVENLELYFPGATYDVPTATLSIPESGNPEEWELLLVVEDGADAIAMWVGKVTARGGDGFEFPGDGLASIPVVFDALSTGDPAEFVKFINVAPGEVGS